MWFKDRYMEANTVLYEDGYFETSKKNNVTIGKIGYKMVNGVDTIDHQHILKLYVFFVYYYQN